MRDLKIICVQPDDVYYTWQVHAWLESLRNIGLSDKAIVLLFSPKGRVKNEKWKQVIDLYPEARFEHYVDDNNEVTNKIPLYIPILRPWTLKKFFKDNPEMGNKAIFYCDSDVLFTEGFNINGFLEDDVNYLSDTNSYINASYFESKIKDVKPDKLEEYKTIDVLGQLAALIGITKETCEKNNLHSGGAQYLFKDVDDKFWEKVEQDCIIIRSYLTQINRKYFESEAKGFQSWCADMWAVLWNLWLRNKETRVVPELNFAWATDPISRLKTTSIYHNAGITGDNTHGFPTFYKGKYHTGGDPFKDPHIQKVLENEESKKYCTHYYLTHLVKLKQKYNLNY